MGGCSFFVVIFFGHRCPFLLDLFTTLRNYNICERLKILNKLIISQKRSVDVEYLSHFSYGIAYYCDCDGDTAASNAIVEYNNGDFASFLLKALHILHELRPFSLHIISLFLFKAPYRWEKQCFPCFFLHSLRDVR